MILIFERSKSLTHKIDTILLAELKRVMPLKYFGFQAANFGSGVLFLCFLCSLVSYIVFAGFLQNAGGEIDPSVTALFAKVMVYSCLAGFVCWFLRVYLYNELDQHLTKYWNVLVNNS